MRTKSCRIAPPLLGWACAAAAVVIGPAAADATALRAGARVRIQTHSQSDFRTATFLGAGADSVVVRYAGATLPSVTPSPAIAGLQISNGTKGRTKAGMLIGAAAGLAFGGVVSALIASDDFFNDADPAAYVAFTAVSTASGALLGAGVGAMIRTERWSDVPPPWRSAERAPTGASGRTAAGSSAPPAGGGR